MGRLLSSPLSLKLINVSYYWKICKGDLSPSVVLTHWLQSFLTYFLLDVNPLLIAFF